MGKRSFGARDGIHICRPSRQEGHDTHRMDHRFLRAAVQSGAVWFAAVSWWKSLTSVFYIEMDVLRLYGILFLFSAVLVFLWNVPGRIGIKVGGFAALGVLAGAWIRLHQDAAVYAINSVANAYLSVCMPEAELYPVIPVSGLQMAAMTGLLLSPALFIWSFSLHVRKGKAFSVLLLLSPSVLSLLTEHVPSEMSCWLVILSGGFFCAVYCCKSGRAALVSGLTAACVLSLAAGISALASQPLERYKKPPDSLYAETRVLIQRKWVMPVRDYIKQAQEEKQREEADREKRQAADREDKTASENIQDPEPSGSFDDEGGSPPERNGIQVDVETGSPGHVPDSPLFGMDEGVLDSSGAGKTDGRTHGFPALDRLSHFQPDQGVHMTVSLDEKPGETFYYPTAYGGIYADSRWNESQADDAMSEEYLQYPDTISRLEAFCRKRSLKTILETSGFIQQEFEKHTAYDYEPGATPSGQDFAEYFLFENKKGFCVHFATTAVLIYRICGFPARYVQGYAIPASAFCRQEDGSYQAEVTGEMGHAWCEVYSGQEWVLKEHTLPYYGVRPAPGAPAAASGNHTWVPDAAGRLLLAAKLLAGILLGIFVLGMLFFVQASIRRQYRYRGFQKKEEGAGIQRLYRAIYDAAVFHGMEQVDILDQRGFESLQKYRPEIEEGEMEWLYRAVLETMFYQRSLTAEELRRGRKLYRQFSAAIKKDQSFCQRFVYQYVKIL